MINLLFPSVDTSDFFKNQYYPKLLFEIRGKTMLERSIENYKCLTEKKYIFLFDKIECQNFHIDNIAKLLSDDKCEIIRLNSNTRGALCTSLLAINHIDNDIPLIIANIDQIISEDINDIIDFFKDKNSDIGLVTFEDIHPRWSYIDIENDKVVEISEKHPITKNALAGVYYFKKGSTFVKNAMKALEKNYSMSGSFYISFAIQEAILSNLTVSYKRIQKQNYHSFYSIEKIEEFIKGEVK